MLGLRFKRRLLHILLLACKGTKTLEKLKDKSKNDLRSLKKAQKYWLDPRLGIYIFILLLLMCIVIPLSPSRIYNKIYPDTKTLYESCLLWINLGYYCS